MLGHLGAISLKLPNFLTTSQDVTKGADQANNNISNNALYLESDYNLLAHISK